MNQTLQEAIRIPETYVPPPNVHLDPEKEDCLVMAELASGSFFLDLLRYLEHATQPNWFSQDSDMSSFMSIQVVCEWIECCARMFQSYAIVEYAYVTLGKEKCSRLLHLFFKYAKLGAENYHRQAALHGLEILLSFCSTVVGSGTYHEVHILRIWEELELTKHVIRMVGRMLEDDYFVFLKRVSFLHAHHAQKAQANLITVCVCLILYSKHPGLSHQQLLQSCPSFSSCSCSSSSFAAQRPLLVRMLIRLCNKMFAFFDHEYLVDQPFSAAQEQLIRSSDRTKDMMYLSKTLEWRKYMHPEGNPASSSSSSFDSKGEEREQKEEVLRSGTRLLDFLRQEEEEEEPGSQQQQLPPLFLKKTQMSTSNEWILISSSSLGQLLFSSRCILDFTRNECSQVDALSELAEWVCKYQLHLQSSQIWKGTRSISDVLDGWYENTHMMEMLWMAQHKTLPSKASNAPVWTENFSIPIWSWHPLLHARIPKLVEYFEAQSKRLLKHSQRWASMWQCSLYTIQFGFLFSSIQTFLFQTEEATRCFSCLFPGRTQGVSKNLKPISKMSRAVVASVFEGVAQTPRFFEDIKTLCPHCRLVRYCCLECMEHDKARHAPACQSVVADVSSSSSSSSSSPWMEEYNRKGKELFLASRMRSGCSSDDSKPSSSSSSSARSKALKEWESKSSSERMFFRGPPI